MQFSLKHCAITRQSDHIMKYSNQSLCTFLVSDWPNTFDPRSYWPVLSQVGRGSWQARVSPQRDEHHRRAGGAPLLRGAGHGQHGDQGRGEHPGRESLTERHDGQCHIQVNTDQYYIQTLEGGLMQ